MKLPKIIVDLIERGAEVNHTDDENRTALHLAVMENRLPFVKYLLDNKADIYVRLELILRKMSDH
jgi:ankyrin repeat protein